MKKGLDSFDTTCYIITCSESNGTAKTKRHGGIAQLGERLTGSQEVSGSIPLISTMKKP